MIRMYFSGYYSYYLAYCFKAKNGDSGFADMILRYKSKLEIQTAEDIEVIKDYIKTKAQQYQDVDIKDVVLMDWRELRKE